MSKRAQYFRGKRPHGRGKKGGRGKGLKGGRGNAGLHKHKFMTMIKYMPDHFGRKGFKRPQSVVRADVTMNLSEITEKLNYFLKEGIAEKKDNLIIIDLNSIGVDKLLGKGKPPEMPLQIKVGKASKKATERIEASGGKIIHG